MDTMVLKISFYTLAGVLCGALCAVLGCTVTDHGDRVPTTTFASGIDLTAPATTTSDFTTAGDTSGPPVDWTTTSGAPDLPTSTCETLQLVGETTIKPVDILFAIDTSGSMSQEAASVVANMNDFSAQIVASGADARVVLIAADSMCIDPPLGSGQCDGADDNPDRYLHVGEVVNSTDSLDVILETSDQWIGFMRPDAARHVVVVSDDNATMKPEQFHAKFTALPGSAGYTFHAIVSALDPDGECGSDPACCDLTADEGTVYLQLIAKTGGVFGDLCDQDFAPVFAALAAHIVETAPIGCTWPLPPPGEDAYDYAAADVRFTLDGAAYSDMNRVADLVACPTGVPAWYYDDPETPTQLLACPWTCDLLTASPAASVAIDLPCLPPEVG